MGYTVYKHTFPNGKVYIGITSLIPSKRCGHNGGKYLQKTNGKYNQPPLAYAILKYGWENIQHEILFENLTQEEAKKKEIELIAQYKSNKKGFGYNIENGGNSSGKVSEETKIKISNGNKGKHVSEDTKKKIGEAQIGEKHWNYGKHLSEEQRKKIGDALRGRRASEETKKKLSIANSGKNHPMYGKHRSQETNEKTSKAVKCIETGISYYSASEAQRRTGIHNSTILRVCRGERESTHNLHWEFVDEKEKSKYKPFKNKAKRRVRCIETNAVYDSIISAAKDMNIVSSAITNAINGRSKTAKGYHWEYI